jgi:hypothetical protein
VIDDFMEAAAFIFRIEELFFSEDGGSRFLQKVDTYLSNYTMISEDSNLHCYYCENHKPHILI